MEKPFVLGQTEWYRVVSVPTGEPGRPTFRIEGKASDLLGETIWVQADISHGTYTTVVSSVLHHLYAEANRK